MDQWVEAVPPPGRGDMTSTVQARSQAVWRASHEATTSPTVRPSAAATASSATRSDNGWCLLGCGHGTELLPRTTTTSHIHSEW